MSFGLPFSLSFGVRERGGTLKNKYLNSQMPKYLDNKQWGELGERDVQVYDLRWVDGFIRQIKPYIYVREHDRLLILVPNQAYKLNESGVTVLKFLIEGHDSTELLRLIGDDPVKRRDMHYFFCDLRAMISGCLREQENRKAIDYYEFTGEFNDLPVLSEIAVTYRCNLHCDFCYVGRRKYGELNTDDLKRILFKIYHEAKVPSVSFTGGEPLLRQDILELVSHARKLGLWTNLITNGTLADNELVRKLKGAGLSSVQVSIEGASPRVHDRITGVRGSFDATKRGIVSFKEAGIPVHTNTTISRNNIADARRIVLFAKDMGLTRLSMNLLIPCGAALEKQDIWVSYSEIGDHILELKHLAEELGLKYLWYSPLPMCRFNPIAHGLGNKSCAAITGLLSIDPMGNIIPCSSWRKPVGSLLSRPFRDIWQSEALRFYKNLEYVPSECAACKELEKCKGACPLYWQARGTSELSGRA
jgi:radical SAM protein with 4Fe4S-binding SPASM domain